MLTNETLGDIVGSMPAEKKRTAKLSVRIPPGFVARLQKLRDFGWGPKDSDVAVNALDEGLKVLERRTQRMVSRAKQ